MLMQSKLDKQIISSSSKKGQLFADSIRKFHRQSLIKQQREELMIQNLGKQIAVQQKLIFTEQNLLKFYTKEYLVQYQINWQVFQNDQFDDPNKCQPMNLIKGILLCRQSSDQAHQNVLRQIYHLVNKQSSVHLMRLEHFSINYFRKIFQKRSLNNKFKINGIHIGTVIEVLPSSQDEKPVNYFIKTHTYGVTQDQVGTITAPKLVNPVQLMVYKILQKMGAGCQSHFFGKDLSNLYIATKDAGFEGPFFTCQQLKNNPAYVKFFESREFSSGIFFLDLLTNILCLTDTLENSHNFGFVKNNGNWQIKVVDFIVTKNKEQYKVHNGYSFRALTGYTQIHYTDKVLRNLYQNQKQGYFVQRAREIILNKFTNFDQILEQSKEDVLQAIKCNIKDTIAGEVYKDMTDKLSQYADAVKCNLGIFQDYLKRTQSNLQ